MSSPYDDGWLLDDLALEVRQVGERELLLRRQGAILVEESLDLLEEELVVPGPVSALAPSQVDQRDERRAILRDSRL